MALHHSATCITCMAHGLDSRGNLAALTAPSTAEPAERHLALVVETSAEPLMEPSRWRDEGERRVAGGRRSDRNPWGARPPVQWTREAGGVILRRKRSSNTWWDLVGRSENPFKSLLDQPFLHEADVWNTWPGHGAKLKESDPSCWDVTV